MRSASFIAKKPLKFVIAAAAVLLSAGTENLASHSESIKAHTGQVHALKLNLNLQRGGLLRNKGKAAAAAAKVKANVAVAASALKAKASPAVVKAKAAVPKKNIAAAAASAKPVAKTVEIFGVKIGLNGFQWIFGIAAILMTLGLLVYVGIVGNRNVDDL